MDVKFYATTSAKLPTLPVVNGTLIYLEDKDDHYYDMGNSRHHVSGVKFVSALPNSGQDDILYVVIDSISGRALASVWNASASTYVPLSGQLATTASVGLVKPDGTTITISNDGTISCHAEVTSLAASAITYDGTASGSTAVNAQQAFDELEAGVADAADLAGIAQSNASTALNRLDAMDLTIADLQSRLAAVEAIAARALITEDPVSQD